MKKMFEFPIHIILGALCDLGLYHHIKDKVPNPRCVYCNKEIDWDDWWVLDI